MNNDTIRPGITIGVPGSGQRIEDLKHYYSQNDTQSPFDPSIAMSYGAESVLRYNHAYVDACHCRAYLGSEMEMEGYY